MNSIYANQRKNWKTVKNVIQAYENINNFLNNTMYVKFAYFQIYNNVCASDKRKE